MSVQYAAVCVVVAVVVGVAVAVVKIHAAKSPDAYAPITLWSASTARLHSPPSTSKYGPKHENDGNDAVPSFPLLVPVASASFPSTGPSVPPASALLCMLRSFGVTYKLTKSRNALAVAAHDPPAGLRTESNTKMWSDPSCAHPTVPASSPAQVARRRFSMNAWRAQSDPPSMCAAYLDTH